MLQYYNGIQESNILLNVHFIWPTQTDFRIITNTQSTCFI